MKIVYTTDVVRNYHYNQCYNDDDDDNNNNNSYFYYY